MSLKFRTPCFFHSLLSSLMAYDSTPHAHSKDGIIRPIQLSELSIVSRHLLPIANARLTTTIDFTGTRSGKNIIVSRRSYVLHCNRWNMSPCFTALSTLRLHCWLRTRMHNRHQFAGDDHQHSFTHRCMAFCTCRSGHSYSHPICSRCRSQSRASVLHGFLSSRLSRLPISCRYFGLYWRPTLHHHWHQPIE